MRERGASMVGEAAGTSSIPAPATRPVSHDSRRLRPLGGDSENQLSRPPTSRETRKEFLPLYSRGSSLCSRGMGARSSGWRDALSERSAPKDPNIGQARYCLEVMKPGGSLSFLRRDGGVLQISGQTGETFSVRCTDARGQTVVEATDVDGRTALSAIGRYLAGDVRGR